MMKLNLQYIEVFDTDRNNCNIDQNFFYHQLEQEKLFNLITNFMQIGPSKAAKY